MKGPELLAVITADPAKVSGGGVPVFHCASEEEAQRIAADFARVSRGEIYRLSNGVLYIMRD